MPPRGLICGRCGAISTDETAAFCGSCGGSLKNALRTPGHSRPPGNAELPPSPGPAGELPPPADPAGVIPPTPGPPSVASAPEPGGTVPGAPISAALVAVPAAPPAPAALGPAALAPPAGAPRDKPFVAPKHLAAGTLIDKKYAVLRVLGEGGMGVVYLARDIHTGLDVVVKAVRSELAHRDDVRARTLAEGRALAQIDHPNVVHLRAVAVEGPHLYLVMQYIDGESLDKIISRNVERREPMPVEEALGIFRQVAAGVGAAHEEGVIHRDLKPANVILRTKDRTAKVTDFGIALVPSDTSRPHTRGILGSLWYMSPEQVIGRRDLDQRVDVYALGIMLYQMLVGRVPFDAKSDYEIMKLHAEAPMPRVATERPDVAGAVDELIQKACSKEREQRFQNCEELVAAVDRILGYGGDARWGQTPGPGLSGQSPPGMTPPIPLINATTGAGAPLMATTSQPGIEDGSAMGARASGEASVFPTAGEQTRRADAPPRRRWPWVLLAATLLVGGAGAALAVGIVPGVPELFRTTRRPPVDAGAPAGSASARAADAGASRVALDALVGSWVGNGRELEAVAAGSDLEFRVKKPAQFPTQGYETGEARFVLRGTPDPSVFTVEDRIRPVLPLGKAYDPRARGTCQEVWTSVGGAPLRARYDGGRLSVEFAKIEPALGNFTMEAGKVTSCVGLRDLKASKVVMVLTRP